MLLRQEECGGETAGAAQTSPCGTFLWAGGAGLRKSLGIVVTLDPDYTALLVRGLIWDLVGQVWVQRGYINQRSSQ